MNVNLIKNDTLLKSSINNTVISLLSSLMLYLSYFIIAYKFGAKSSTDIYFFGVSFIQLGSSIITSIITFIFLPIFVKLRVQGKIEDSMKLASIFLSWILIVSLVIGAVLLFFTVDVFSIFSKFEILQLKNNSRMLSYFSYIFVLTVIVEFVKVLIQSHGQFIIPATSTLFLNTVTVISILLLPKYLSIESLAIALLFARMVQLSYLTRYIYMMGIRLKINLAANASMMELVIVGLPFWLSNIFTIFATYYFDFAASGLHGGTLTALSYAQKIYILPSAILFAPILEVMSTKFAQYYASGSQILFREQYEKILKLVTFTLLPISAILIFFSYELVEIAFHRGEFSLENVKVSSNCLRIYSIIIPAICFFQINGRISLSMQKTLWPSIFGLVGHLLMVYFTKLFVLRYGYLGIPLARTLTELLYFLPFGFICTYYYLGDIGLNKFIKVFWKNLLIVLFSITITRWVLYPLVLHIWQYVSSSLLFPISISFIMYAIIYYFICRYFKIEIIQFIEYKLLNYKKLI